MSYNHLQVHVESLCSKQKENEVEVRGPPVSKAFDNQGNPTKVLYSWKYRILCAMIFVGKMYDVNTLCIKICSGFGIKSP